MLLPILQQKHTIQQKRNKHTGLVLGNVSRRCRRRLFFGSLIFFSGFALTSRTDTPLVRV
jgi:hypothetical protein